MKWLLPLEGWHKENFDGASKGNLAPLGCGGIIRNNYGGGVATFSHPLVFQTTHFSKASAACHTVKLAFNMGIKKLWLKGDSNNIIRCIKGITQPSWSIADLIEETRNLVQNFECVHITHVYREANLVADWFANEAFRLDKVMT